MPAEDPREYGPFTWRRDDGVQVSTDQSRLDIDLVHRFIASSYWAMAMPRVVLERAIRHSLCFGVYLADGRQAGFARVITDRSTYAYLSDVFVLEGHRGAGLGRYLIECVLDCPALKGLRRFSLFTRDAEALYAPFGFGPHNPASHYMEIRDPGTYSKPRDEFGWPET
jgi:GNAT superfamily N-acetyltransferase